MSHKALPWLRESGSSFNMEVMPMDKASSAHVETQSAWIVHGTPAALPCLFRHNAFSAVVLQRARDHLRHHDADDKPPAESFDATRVT